MQMTAIAILLVIIAIIALRCAKFAAHAKYRDRTIANERMIIEEQSKQISELKALKDKEVKRYAKLFYNYTALYWSHDHVRQRYIALRYPDAGKLRCDVCKRYMKPSHLHFGLDAVEIKGAALPDAICKYCLTNKTKKEGEQ